MPWQETDPVDQRTWSAQVFGAPRCRRRRHERRVGIQDISAARNHARFGWGLPRGRARPTVVQRTIGIARQRGFCSRHQRRASGWRAIRSDRPSASTIVRRPSLRGLLVPGADRTVDIRRWVRGIAASAFPVVVAGLCHGPRLSPHCDAKCFMTCGTGSDDACNAHQDRVLDPQPDLRAAH
jgi:hypothetical protein